MGGKTAKMSLDADKIHKSLHNLWETLLADGYSIEAISTEITQLNSIFVSHYNLKAGLKARKERDKANGIS